MYRLNKYFAREKIGSGKDSIIIRLCLLVILFILLFFMVTHSHKKEILECGIQFKNKRIVCWETKIETLTKNKGAKAALYLLERVKKKDVLFNSDCHVYAHIISDVVYWQYKRQGKLEIGGEASVCDYGFILGFMQEAGHHDPQFFELAPKLCEILTVNFKEDLKEGAISQCYHGIGHGILMFYVDKYPKQELEITKRGIADCKKIAREDGDKFRNCVMGIYGGIGDLYIGNHGYLWPIRESDPSWFCKYQPIEFMKGCFVSLIPGMFSYWKHDFGKVFDIIEKIENIDYAQESFLYAGILLGRRTIDGEKTDTEIIKLCQSLGRGLDLYCIEGVGGGLFHYSLADFALENSNDFCNLDLLNASQKAFCFKGIKEQVRLGFTPSELSVKQWDLIKSITTLKGLFWLVSDSDPK